MIITAPYISHSQHVAPKRRSITPSREVQVWSCTYTLMCTSITHKQADRRAWTNCEDIQAVTLHLQSYKIGMMQLYEEWHDNSIVSPSSKITHGGPCKHIYGIISPTDDHGARLPEHGDRTNTRGLRHLSYKQIKCQDDAHTDYTHTFPWLLHLHSDYARGLAFKDGRPSIQAFNNLASPLRTSTRSYNRL
jgi:hypothetical protein